MTEQEIRSMVLAWYEEYRDGLYGFVFALLRDHAHTEDIVQSVFADLLSKGDHLSEIRHPKTYIHHVGRYLAYRLLKSPARRLTEPVVEATAATNAVDDHVAAQAVNWALAQLPPEDRALVIMKVYEGMSFKEMARVTGCLLPTTASRYFRALKRLKTLLEDHHGNR